MNTKAAIQFGALSLTLEGSEDFVSQQLDRFSDLIVSHAGDLAQPADATDVGEMSAPEVSAKPRKARSASGSGTGCSAKVKSLLADGFFREGRTAKVVSDRLRELATPYPVNKVSAALINLARAKQLRRYQEAGDWL